MTVEQPAALATPLTLAAQTAADLMTPSPLSIPAAASVTEATAFLIGRGFSAAPVIDEAGRPVGVLSTSDILIHHRHRRQPSPGMADFYDRYSLTLDSASEMPEAPASAGADTASVRDLMTPVVFSVPPHTPARRVVEEMLELKVHRLFVVGPGDVLVGVISTLDVLRALVPPTADQATHPTQATR